MATRLKTSSKSITLAGSTKIITDFFNFSLNSILYQRAIYPPSDFTLVKKYGLTLFTSSDEALQNYIQNILNQLNTWLSQGNVTRLVMAIITTETRQTIERWQFDINLEPTSTTESSTTEPPKKDKSMAQIQKDIQDIIRQITSSVTFLPSIEEKCLFNILVYTDIDTTVPEQWLEADPHLIQGRAEQVKLRSFSTNIHKVEALVAYRLGETL